jgi:hypothetical protein
MNRIQEFLKYYEKQEYENLNIDNKFFYALLGLYPESERIKMLNNKESLLNGYKSFNRLDRVSSNQEPSLNSILQDINKKIMSVLKENDIRLEKKVALTSLTRGEIRIAQRVMTEDENVICMYSTTSEFLYFMSVVISSFFRKDEVDLEMINCRWEESYNLNQQGRKLFTEIMNAIQSDKWTTKYQWYQVSYIKEYSYLLYHPAEMFGIAHEYAHIIYKHLEGDNVSAAKNISNELQADKLAFEITMAYFCNKEQLPIAYMGIDFLFCCLQIYQNVRRLRTAKNYPLLMQRRLELCRYMETRLQKDAESIKSLNKTNEKLIQMLYEDTFKSPLLLDI